MADYLQAVGIELARVTEAPVLDTLFLGGGTPTHLPPDLLRQLMALIHSRFELAPDAEFSVEANPADLTDEILDVLYEFGVNRISLGVQSFDDAMLRTLERDHRRSEIQDCLSRIRRRICNISLDLIFAVPGQSLQQWQTTLAEAIALQPQHLSTYGLTFEKGTSFWSRRERGQLQQADEELERDMYAASMDNLEAAGFVQYEISSFAKTGFRCRHNQTYWNGNEFFGFGPGAASYLNGCRILNHRSVKTWLQRTLNGQSAIVETETLDPDDRARERLVLGLRQTGGIRQDHFEEQTGVSAMDLAGAALRQLIENGLVEEDTGSLRLTREGRFLADTVAGELLS